MNRLDEYSYPTSFDRRQWAKLWKLSLIHI